MELKIIEIIYQSAVDKLPEHYVVLYTINDEAFVKYFTNEADAKEFAGMYE